VSRDVLAIVGVTANAKVPTPIIEPISILMIDFPNVTENRMVEILLSVIRRPVKDMAMGVTIPRQ